MNRRPVRLHDFVPRIVRYIAGSDPEKARDLATRSPIALQLFSLAGPTARIDLMPRPRSVGMRARDPLLASSKSHVSVHAPLVHGGPMWSLSMRSNRLMAATDGSVVRMWDAAANRMDTVDGGLMALLDDRIVAGGCFGGVTRLQTFPRGPAREYEFEIEAMTGTGRTIVAYGARSLARLDSVTLDLLSVFPFQTKILDLMAYNEHAILIKIPGDNNTEQLVFMDLDTGEADLVLVAKRIRALLSAGDNDCFVPFVSSKGQWEMWCVRYTGQSVTVANNERLHDHEAWTAWVTDTGVVMVPNGELYWKVQKHP